MFQIDQKYQNIQILFLFCSLKLPHNLFICGQCLNNFSGQKKYTRYHGLNSRIKNPVPSLEDGDMEDCQHTFEHHYISCLISFSLVTQ